MKKPDSILKQKLDQITHLLRSSKKTMNGLLAANPELGSNLWNAAGPTHSIEMVLIHGPSQKGVTSLKFMMDLNADRQVEQVHFKIKRDEPGNVSMHTEDDYVPVIYQQHHGFLTEEWQEQIIDYFISHYSTPQQIARELDRLTKRPSPRCEGVQSKTLLL